jgi:hypothetical protein
MGFSVKSKANFYKSCDPNINQKLYAEFKKLYFIGSEIQPVVIRAQKREIQICRVTF